VAEDLPDERRAGHNVGAGHRHLARALPRVLTDITTVQAQVLMRANDPLYEISMSVAGHSKEDKFWTATLTALGQRLGVADPKVEARSTCVDSRRQWRHTSNIWHNSMVRSVLQTVTFRRGVKAQPSG
jgi:hypothetical protein